jgi:hypothetical protein
MTAQVFEIIKNRPIVMLGGDETFKRYKPFPLWADVVIHLSLEEPEYFIYTNTFTPLQTTS